MRGGRGNGGEGREGGCYSVFFVANGSKNGNMLKLRPKFEWSLGILSRKWRKSLCLLSRKAISSNDPGCDGGMYKNSHWFNGKWYVSLMPGTQSDIHQSRRPDQRYSRSRWKSFSENYLLTAEFRFMVRVMVRVRDSKTIFHENYFWWMSNCVFSLRQITILTMR